LKAFKGHEACPQCGSSDNVGVWDDGQKYCFGGCGYWMPGYKGMSIADIKKQIKYEEEKERRNVSVSLPADFSLVLRQDAGHWLEKYDVSDSERFKYKIGWSDIYESLVFPAFDYGGNLLLCQRRYFGADGFPKYHTKGFPESVLWSARPSAVDTRPDPYDTFNGTLVLVEDFVSAVRVGRSFEASPLWGSNFSLGQLKRVSDRWERLVIWLDPDKTKEAVKLRLKAEPYFESACVITSPKDPKDYNDAVIKELVAYVD
jgi:hypothetical protein